MRDDSKGVSWGGLTYLLTSVILAIPTLPPPSGCLSCPDACPCSLRPGCHSFLQWIWRGACRRNDSSDIQPQS